MVRRASRWFFLVGCAVSCSGKIAGPRGELMLAIETDMAIPKDVDRIRIEVLSFGSLQFGNDYDVGQGRLRLPATLAVLAGPDPSKPITVRVIARQAGVARVLQEVVTTVPSNRIAVLPIPLQWLCTSRVQETSSGVSTTCAPTERCVAGACVPQAVDSAKLPRFAPADVFGGGDGSGSGTCFDTAPCFASAPPVAVDLDACTAPMPDPGPDGTGPNFALMRPLGSDGICDDATCWVPLEADDAYGWKPDSAGRAALPRAVCERLGAGDVLAVASSNRCPSKTLHTPTCGPWSAVSASPTIPAGPPPPPPPPPAPIVLTSRTSPRAIAVSGPNVFWTEGANAVWTCPIASCAGNETALSTNESAPVALATADQVYWVNANRPPAAGTLRSCSLGSCAAPTTLIPGGNGALAVAADSTVSPTVVYWVDSNGALTSCDPSNCAGTLTTQGAPTAPTVGNALTLDASFVYWTAGATNNGVVYQCNRNGCGVTPTPLVQFPNPRGIAVSKDTVFFAHATGISGVAIAGGPATLVASGSSMEVVLVDGLKLYFGGKNGLEWCSLTNCPATQRTWAPGVVSGLAQDQKNLYWTTDLPNGVLYMIAKP